MNKPFSNTEAPEYFVGWAIRNLEMTADKDAIARTCDKNIAANAGHEDIEEITRLFTNFKNELRTHRHSDLRTHYANLAKTPVAV